MSMDKWNALKQPPKEALKTIGGGRLKGMTDIKPQWRFQAMTEQWGQCGDGWKYTIDKLWMDAGTDGQVMVFALISLYTNNNGIWSAPIPGIGGSLMIMKESSGLHCSDECYKMAVTDALSVAMKALGMAADVYMGAWDGSKYRDSPEDDHLADIVSWKQQCDEYAPDDLETFRGWFKSNRKAIEMGCGQAGAVQVYAHFIEVGKQRKATP